MSLRKKYECTYGSVDLLVKVSLLQLEGPGVVLDLGVGVVLDVHGRLLALGLADAGVTVGLRGEERDYVVSCVDLVSQTTEGFSLFVLSRKSCGLTANGFSMLT